MGSDLVWVVTAFLSRRNGRQSLAWARTGIISCALSFGDHGVVDVPGNCGQPPYTLTVLVRASCNASGGSKERAS